MSKTRKKLLGVYAEAAACLYGVLSINEYVEVFNHYENEKTNIVEAARILEQYVNDNPDTIEYDLYEDLITGPTFHPDSFNDDIEYVEAVRAEQRGKPRYLPEKNEFLRYKDAMYREPEKPYADLKAYILKNKLCIKDNINGVDGDLLDLHEMIQNRLDPSELIQYFIDIGYPLHDLDEINAFMQFVMTAHNNTRIYENNGFTPDELRKIYASQRPKDPILHQPVKAGRNDPCPCGSGKKFKKCCALVEISGAAQLSPFERKLFYETWYKLLDYVNRKLAVVDYKFSLSYPDYHDETLLHKIREQLWNKPKLISKFIADTDNLSDEEINLLQSWEKHHIKGEFALVKHALDASILMHMEKGKESKLYAVKGMTTSIAEATHLKLPIMLETVLLPFNDKIIYDSFIGSYAIEFGGGVMDIFESEYAKSEKKYGIINHIG